MDHASWVHVRCPPGEPPAVIPAKPKVERDPMYLSVADTDHDVCLVCDELILKRSPVMHMRGGLCRASCVSAI